MRKTKDGGGFVPLGEIKCFVAGDDSISKRHIAAIGQDYDVFPIPGENGEVRDNLYDLVFGPDTDKKSRGKFTALIQKQPALVEFAGELASDIGMLDAIKLRKEETGYSLIAGCGRWLATVYNWITLHGAKEGVGDRIAAEVREEVQEQSVHASFSSNFYFNAPDPVSEGEHFARLHKGGMKYEEIASRLFPAKAKSAAMQLISRRVKLASGLTEAQKNRVRTGDLKLSKAEDLADAQKGGKAKRAKRAAGEPAKLHSHGNLMRLYEEEGYFEDQHKRLKEHVEIVRQFLADILELEYQTFDDMDDADNGVDDEA